ncbi:AarF/UbiB family protein [uncultured Endozoicomonas sp.]|uniref:AarF/UbiB family protein n=1 Tax=uncultured Endozoicomonas sp. TaxID=432652 RepID=UPI00260173F3|nr:AarF/UbiB family protein [uncultured Endozoicomonas sp.]
MISHAPKSTTTHIQAPNNQPETKDSATVKLKPIAKHLEPNFDPTEVPANKLIKGRQPRTLSSIEWLGNAIKNGFYTFIREIKIMGIFISIWWNNASIDSIKKAAADSQGGIIVKAIQFACSSQEIARSIFGNDCQKFMDALSHVTTSNEPMSLKELEHCLKEANIPYDTAKLDKRVNLGTGSIGEANEIILKNGGKQVVKFVSPSSEIRVHSDLKVLRFVMSLLSFFKPDIVKEGTKNAFFEFFDSIKEELNLVNEAQRTQKQAQAFSAIKSNHLYHITNNELSDCAKGLPNPVPTNGIEIHHPETGQHLVNIPVEFKVPKVSGQYTTHHTLSMDKIHGVTLSENDQGHLRNIAAKLLNVNSDIFTDEQLKAFRYLLKQTVFQQWAYCYSQTGFFNADMHDGNVMVAVENGKLCIYFIDLGNAQRVSRETVKATYTILGALEKLREAEKNSSLEDRFANVVIENLKSMGNYTNKANWAKLKEVIKAHMKDGGRYASIEKSVTDIFDLAYPCGIKIPKEITGLFRAQTLIDSQYRSLNEDALKNAFFSLLKTLQQNHSPPAQHKSDANTSTGPLSTSARPTLQRVYG